MALRVVVTFPNLFLTLNKIIQINNLTKQKIFLFICMQADFLET